MTTEIRTELKRLLDKLPETDPTTDDYISLLRSIEVLGMGPVSEIAEALAAEADEPSPKENVTDISEAKAKKAKAKKPESEPEPEPEPEPELEPEATGLDYKALGIETEDGKPTKVGVRAFLGACRNTNGVDITALLTAIGVSKLSAVDPADYDKLIQMAIDAKEGK